MDVSATWKCFKYKADANKVYDEILSIGEQATPQQIVEKAKDESSELHKCFTWDNDEAAAKWRLHEARTIVCNLVVVPRDDTESPITQYRLFYKTDSTEDSGYKSTLKIVRNNDEYSKMLQLAYAELAAFKKKYSMLAELQEIIEMIP